MPTGKQETLSAFCLGKLKSRDHLEDTIETTWKTRALDRAYCYCGSGNEDANWTALVRDVKWWDELDTTMIV
jgi:hypothetical protein